MKYQVISEEQNTKGRVLFEGTLKECYEFRRRYYGERYPSLSSVK